MAPKVNMLYLLCWMVTVSIGMFQFGYSISMFNIFTKVLYHQYDDKGKAVIHNQDDFNAAVTAISPLGAAFGAFTGGMICSLGRRNAIFIANAIIIVGVSITMIFNFYALLAGRFVFGYGVGAYTVISPLFISETSPAHIAGSLGAINQFMVCAGIMVADILGFAVPYESVKGGQEGELNPEVLSTKVWRWVFIAPAGIAVIQTALVLFIFRNDTPKFYKQKGDKAGAERVENLIIADKGTEINKSVLDEDKSASNAKVPVSALFTDRYRMAFLVGCGLALVQQLTGINAVMFYSNDIFTKGRTGYDSEKAAKVGTMLVGVVNWASAMAAIPLLTRFGRKTLLIFGQIGMGISLLTLAILAIKDWETGIKIFTLCFVAFFEFSVGPILWLYAAEIMTESGMAAASLITWIITVVFGLFTNKFFDWLKPEGVYFMFTGIDVVGLLFILFLVKETKGLSKEAIANLYAPRKYHKAADDEY